MPVQFSPFHWRWIPNRQLASPPLFRAGALELHPERQAGGLAPERQIAARELATGRRAGALELHPERQAGGLAPERQIAARELATGRRAWALELQSERRAGAPGLAPERQVAVRE